MIENVKVESLKKYTDNRGWLTECFRQDELEAGLFPAMLYVSQTQPGIARGPHEHVEQTDIFVFLGPGAFRVYLWDARKDSSTYGEKMSFEAGADNPTRVIVPPGVVHAYKCVSETPGLVLNAPDKLYAGRGKKEKVDEIRHENEPNSPYQMD